MHTNHRLSLALLIALPASCDPAVVEDDGGSTDASIDAGPAAPCDVFGPSSDEHPLTHPELVELSGLAASRRNAGVLYAHNDSGDSPRVFVLSETGEDLGTIELTSAAHVDYEDIAVGPGPDGESWVYVGDIGDNAARTGAGAARDFVVLYRFPEPAIAVSDGALRRDLTPEAITIRYPAAPHDCESLAVDPTTGDLLFLTKEDAGPSTLYVAQAPLAPDVVLEPLGTADVGGSVAPGSQYATAMDISPGGGALLLRTYGRLFLFEQTASGWADAFALPGLRVASSIEVQGEAVAWSADGRAYFTASEGAGVPLHRHEATDPGCLAR